MRALVNQAAAVQGPRSSCSAVQAAPAATCAAGQHAAARRQRRWAVAAAADAGSGGLSYKDAGVDIDAGNELVKRIQKLNPNIGGFSGMVPFGERGCWIARWLSLGKHAGCKAPVQAAQQRCCPPGQTNLHQVSWPRALVACW